MSTAGPGSARPSAPRRGRRLHAWAWLAEGEGFEPPRACAHTGFQDRRLQPLGHPSGLDITVACRGANTLLYRFFAKTAPCGHCRRSPVAVGPPWRFPASADCGPSRGCGPASGVAGSTTSWSSRRLQSEAPWSRGGWRGAHPADRPRRRERRARSRARRLRTVAPIWRRSGACRPGASSSAGKDW